MEISNWTVPIVVKKVLRKVYDLKIESKRSLFAKYMIIVSRSLKFTILRFWNAENQGKDQFQIRDGVTSTQG